MNKWDESYYRFYFSFLNEIDELYGASYDEIARAAYSAGLPTDKRFTFRGNKRLSETTDGVLKRLAEATTAAIAVGASHTWNLSNDKNDEIARAFLHDRAIPERFMYHNADKLAALQKRKIDGLTVSSRVWKYTETLKTDLEMAVDVALREGTSAAELSRSIRRNLNNPDALFRRVRNQYGQLVPSKAMLAYHPGAGVYRSAAQNAIRLAGTEVNMAYREADLLRWGQMDFVVGYKIQNSPRRTTVCPLCDELQGVYPKSFVWTGWHPRCRCYATPVLAKEVEFIDWLNNGGSANFSGQITDTPPQFKRWTDRHREDIAKSIHRGKIPYFLRDNDGKYVDLSAHKLSALQMRVVDNRARYLTYDTKQWRRELFDKQTGGYVVINNNRFIHSQVSKGEREKYVRELSMANIYARNGFAIEMRNDLAGGGTFDVYANGFKADLKRTQGHGNVVKYAKHAVREQGASMVLFQFDVETAALHKQIEVLRCEKIKGHFFFTGREDKIYKL